MDLKKIKKFDAEDLESLEKMHTEIHSIFNQIINGARDDWTFTEVYRFHKEIWNALINAGGKHIAPLDQLDNIELYEQDSVLSDYSHLEEKRELGKINYSGNVEGDEIFLKDILSEFGKFKLKEPFVYIVGGLVNHGKTKGDIDILIKKSRPEDDSEDIPLKFRIMRQLPQKYWSRLHFLYDDAMHGPFTNYVPLYSLVCDINTKEVYEMSEDFSELSSISISEQAAKSRKENKIIPFRFFTQPKPVHGRGREEIYSLDSIEETMKKLKKWAPEVDKGIFVERKFDGVRTQIHKVGDKVLIMSEEGKDYTSNLPTIVNELKKLKFDFVVEGEAELWLKGKHENRSDSAGLLNSKSKSENEKFMIISLYDCLWFEGKDFHKEIFADRRNVLDKIKSTHVKVSEAKLVKGFPGIKRLSKRFASLPGSEGVMYKLQNYIYELDGQSLNFMKFKKERSIIAKVVAVHKVAKAEKTFYYHCAIEGNTYIGKTFNTNIKVNAGEKLEVVFVDLNQYLDPATDKTWFNWWAPRVTAKSNKPVTSVEEAKKIVQDTSGQIGEKKVPKISREELEEVLVLDSKTGKEKFVNISELSFQKRFVFQNHYRGKSVHGDLRFERNGHLEGYTLMHQVKKEIPNPVMSVEDAKKEDLDDSNFKINLKTGELKQDKIEIATKSQQPKVWLTMKGITKSAEPGDPHSKPEPGATKKYPGVFTIIDSGTYEEGARKSQYFEYFMHGKVFKGRYIVRILSREKIAKGEKVRTPFIWFFWKAKDENPYVLSSRSIAKAYVPERGKSALPSVWEKKIPKNLKWWERNLSGEKALEMIKEIRKLFLKKSELASEDIFPTDNIPIDKSIDEELKKQKVEFKLTHDWWKGQTVIRGLPVEHWSLKFKTAKWPYFSLNKNPLNNESGISGIKKKGSQALFDLQGIIPAGRSPNPNKKIPMHIDDLDEGSCLIIEDSENFMHVEFSGKQLKGNWIFKREDAGSNIWNVSKAELPEKNVSNFGEPFSDDELKTLHFLSDNNIGISAISRHLNRPCSSCLHWAGKL